MRSERVVRPSTGGELHGLVDIDGHEARHPRLTHRHAGELADHFHSRLVMRDAQELNCLRHIPYDVTEASDICIVERSIDLVEETEWRGIQLKDREDQSDSRQRLLTTGQQVNCAVAFARRTRHDRDTGIQQIITVEAQVGMTAAE